MKKFFTGLFAASLGLSFTAASFVPAQAAPVVPRAAVQSNVIDVQGSPQVQRGQARGNRQMRREFRQDRREFRRDRRDFRNARREFRQDRRDFRQGRRGFYRDGRYGFYNGHRGYRDYRPGYRRHNDFWFPAAAFLGGAIIGGALSNPAPVYRRSVGSAHVEWCYNRYRSYRASDNTFQPYNGPRQQCWSPYS